MYEDVEADFFQSGGYFASLFAATKIYVRTQRPTHLPLATAELRYKVFKTLVEENQTLSLLFQTHCCDP